MTERTRYHIITRLLVIAGIVAALPLAVGFVLIQHSAKTRLTDAAGENFYWFAERAASAVDTAMVREFEFVSSVAGSPALLNGLRARGAAAAKEELDALAESSALYRDLVLLDPEGNVVAGPELDERWLSDARHAVEKLKGPRAVDAFAEMGDDTSSLTLVRPIRDPDSKELLGFLRAELDTERLFASVSDLRIGETGHACLFDRGSSRLLAGRTADCTEGNGYGRREELDRASRQGRGYFLAGVGGPASFDRGVGLLVGYARPELSRTLPELDWIVAVEQSLAEAHAPLAPLSRDLIVYFLGMGFLVLVLAAYMSYKLERPLTDTVLALHEKLPRPDGVAEEV